MQSMTGFAAATGAGEGYSWAWDLRSVNSKGLDLRLRVPDWIAGLEPKLRAHLGGAVTRGAVTLSLRLARDDSAGEMTLNDTALTNALAAMARIEAQAMDLGLSLAPANAAQILALRGLYDTTTGDVTDSTALLTALLAEVAPLIAAFKAMRASEGAALAQILTRQLDEIEALVTGSVAAAEARRAEAAANLRAALARVLDNTEGVEESRIAQELAMIAVKTDVTEEIDRLRAHITAARALIAETAPVGRKFDFLMQEFNREANTLCSKAQSAELTRIGLELKTVIDQMREQVQNVE